MSPPQECKELACSCWIDASPEALPARTQTGLPGCHVLEREIATQAGRLFRPSDDWRLIFVSAFEQGGQEEGASGEGWRGEQRPGGGAGAGAAGAQAGGLPAGAAHAAPAPLPAEHWLNHHAIHCHAMEGSCGAHLVHKMAACYMLTAEEPMGEVRICYGLPRPLICWMRRAQGR